MESDLIRWLKGRVAPGSEVPLGIGDDAAILQFAQDARTVVTTDMLMDGVDFQLEKVGPRRAGRKTLAVNLSDLAAMGARPRAALIALALPRKGGLSLAQELYEGLIPLAEKYSTAIVGGDTNSWDGPLVASVTVFGEAAKENSFLRSGAKVGDAVVVTGEFGGSILGHHLDFEPRVREALWLREHYPIHAAIDVSDGLSLDLARLAEASQCGAVLDLRKIPIRPAAEELARRLNDGSTALDHALSDGEDFELILTMPADSARELIETQPLDCGVACIGHIVAQAGLWQADARGTLQPLAARGFEHRFDS